MKIEAEKIRDIVVTVEDQLKSMTAEKLSARETPASWSRKEILGHLIDSAANNHQRIVRACYDAATNFPPYHQNEWVQIQQYDQVAWRELVEFWMAYNRHLSHLIERVPTAARNSPMNIGLEVPVTLRYVIEDYLRHLQHHLRDILGEQDQAF